MLLPRKMSPLTGNKHNVALILGSTIIQKLAPIPPLSKVFLGSNAGRMYVAMY